MKVIHPENIWQSPSPAGWEAMSNPKVPSREPAAFKEYRVPQAYLDQLERCRAARAAGKSWRPE